MVTLRISAYEVSVDCTLGDVVTVVLCTGVAVGVLDGSRGFCILDVTGSGSCSIILSCVDSVRRAFRIESPDFKERVLDGGGYVNLFTMSDAAYFR